jgi:hypothetical protein
MAHVYVGIVEGPPPGTVGVGLVEADDGGRFGAGTFELEPAQLGDYYAAKPDGGMEFRMPPDLGGLGRFLQERIPDRKAARFLIEVPEALPHPADAHDALPHPVLPIDSVILKVLAYLGVAGYVAAPFQIGGDGTVVVVFPILSSGEHAHLRSLSPKYLRQGVSRAFGELLSLEDGRPEHAAVVAALIAKNPGAYHLWSSIGRVQSSQDVVMDLRHREERSTLVMSAAEDYALEFTRHTRYDAIDDVPLEYALIEQRYAHLGTNDAIKAALIGVCMQWRILLRCSSKRDDAEEPGREHPVYPLGVFETMIIGALNNRPDLADRG